ncbi:MAG TPA: hypothetical protein VD860_16715 [Azospirillum sp.]|nr:hypothetical protein [Azospirillum sp.]
MSVLPRREVLKISAAGVALAWLPAGCGSDEGPGAIKLGRDACDFCGMIISELRYAAEIRGGPSNKLFKFDDVGCAVHFTTRNAWAAEPAAKFWAMSHQDGTTWLDARQAVYRQGLPTPMGYGFAAVPNGADTVPFDAMKAATLKRTECAPTATNTADAGEPR